MEHINEKHLSLPSFLLILLLSKIVLWFEAMDMDGSGWIEDDDDCDKFKGIEWLLIVFVKWWSAKSVIILLLLLLLLLLFVLFSFLKLSFKFDDCVDTTGKNSARSLDEYSGGLDALNKLTAFVVVLLLLVDWIKSFLEFPVIVVVVMDELEFVADWCWFEIWLAEFIAFASSNCMTAM